MLCQLDDLMPEPSSEAHDSFRDSGKNELPTKQNVSLDFPRTPLQNTPLALHDRVSLAGDTECSLVEAIFCDIIEFTHRVTPSNA
jgi:hypothetical protein